MIRDERYRDGATVRQRRLLTICQQIEDREDTDTPMTVDALCTIMTLVDGLTRQRTQQYVRELSLAQVVAEDPRNGRLRMKKPVAHIIGLIASKRASE